MQINTEDNFMKWLCEQHDFDALGSFYDDYRIDTVSYPTPNSRVFTYALRRRQDHAHSKPWDFRITVVHRGSVVNTIAVPN